ncbi:MAG: GGDEF domain-containing protein [Edaphobacter sp.]
MNYAFLPDLLALAILIALFLLLRQRHPQQQANVWLLGLLITLVESSAHIFYNAHGMPIRSLHVIVVDCYLIAGVVFTWDSGKHTLPRRTRFLYLALNALPLLAINTLYGLHIDTPAPYYPAIAAGLLIAGASTLYLHRTWRVTIIHLAGWLIIGYLIRGHEFRQAVYWSLCAVYAIAALKFQRRLPGRSTGKLAILTGFYIWSLCFFVHPFIVTYRDYADIASHVWNMQKALISLGMILVMLEEQLSNNQWLALHDDLTGLPNRRSFEDQLNSTLDRCRRRNVSLALLLLDLDGFKRINDTLGHQAGDQVLCGVANNLRESLPVFNTLARLGGDEFTLIAADLEDNQSVDHLLNSIRNAVEKPLLVDGHSLIVTASLGVAIYPDDADNATHLLRIADQRMYKLKQKPPFRAEAEFDIAPSPFL